MHGGNIYNKTHPTMTRQTLNKQLILDLYNQDPSKGKYWVADQLGLNRSSVSTLISRYCSNSLPIDSTLEHRVKETIQLFPYTGTKAKISKHLGISHHLIEQLLHKTQDVLIIEHFERPKCSSSKLTDTDIQDILDGSKLGIGNDQMGLIKGVDGISIRNIRKKLLTKEEYAQYHSIERFYSGDYNAYYNDRGDKFLSTWEEKLADYLFSLGVKYFSNVRLSYGGKNYSPDFYLPKTRTFIEVFGMSNVSTYQSKMNEKIEFYNSNNIKCLFLFEDSFLLNKKYVDSYKVNLDNFLSEIEGHIFNPHIKKIHINHKK
jgi:hypothetical protein